MKHGITKICNQIKPSWKNVFGSVNTWLSYTPWHSVGEMEGLLFRKRIWPLISNVLEFIIRPAERLFWLRALTPSPGVKRKNFENTCSHSPLLHTWMIPRWMSREGYFDSLLSPSTDFQCFLLAQNTQGPKHVVMEGAYPQHLLPTLQPVFKSFLSTCRHWHHDCGTILE